MFICYRCFDESPTLKARFQRDGSPGQCEICHRRSRRVLDAAELEDLFVGLASLYEVAQRGEHFHRDYDDGDEFVMGDTGDPLPQLLQEEWPIFADDVDTDDIEKVLRCVWPAYTGDLYAKEALWYRHPDDEWDAIKRHVKHVRRFFPRRRDFDFTTLPSLLKPFVDRLTASGTTNKWLRARIQRNGVVHKRTDMAAPPPEKAAAGRANPAGISYLYLSSDEHTACAEVRAEPGHVVTIAQFKIAKPLKLLDVAASLRGIDPFAHSDLRGEIERSTLIRAFARDLSKPVLAEDSPIDYVPTQYLAEYFASRGFDGIHYRSSVAAGTNLVLFRPEKATITRMWNVQIEKKVLEFSRIKSAKAIAPH